MRSVALQSHTLQRESLLEVEDLSSTIMMNQLTITWLMIKPHSVYCITQYSTLSSLLTLNASRYGMLAQESFKVSSEILLIVKSLASVWMRERESYSLETRKVDYSPST